jgi:hypothetical protein
MVYVLLVISKKDFYKNINVLFFKYYLQITYMRIINRFTLLLIFIVLQIMSTHGHSEECTIGVALGRATSDGRPLLWKTRDNNEAPDNTIKYDTKSTYKFIYVANAGTTSDAWMGVNELGFAIINSAISDLPTTSKGLGNGTLMKYVLGSCKTVVEFENYLKATNITGRATQANFAVIDATGAAAIFETGGSVYYKYNAEDTENGYIIRTNFSFNGGSNKGIERYIRSTDLINTFYAGDTLNHKSIIRYQMRDFSDDNSDPVAIPFTGRWSPETPEGYVHCDKSICRTSTVSASVIQGVLSNESPCLSTMWTMLGHAATTVSIPYWPVSDPPVEAKGNPKSVICNNANEIKKFLFDIPDKKDYINTVKLHDGNGGGIFPYLFTIEDSIFSNTERFLDSIRVLEHLPVNALIEYEAWHTVNVHIHLQEYINSLTGYQNNTASMKSIKIYPNPTNDKIYIDCTENNDLKMHIYNIAGCTAMFENLNFGINEVNVKSLTNGIYSFHISNHEKTFQRKLIKN